MYIRRQKCKSFIYNEAGFFSSFPQDNLGLVIQSKIIQYLDMAKKQTNKHGVQPIRAAHRLGRKHCSHRQWSRSIYTLIVQPIKEATKWQDWGLTSQFKYEWSTDIFQYILIKGYLSVEKCLELLLKPECAQREEYSWGVVERFSFVRPDILQ